MSYNGDKFPTCGLHFLFPGPAECDCCNLSVTTQSPVWFLDRASLFWKMQGRKPLEHPFPSWSLIQGGSDVWGQPTPWQSCWRKSPWVSTQVAMGTQQVPGDWKSLSLLSSGGQRRKQWQGKQNASLWHVTQHWKIRKMAIFLYLLRWRQRDNTVQSDDCALNTFQWAFWWWYNPSSSKCAALLNCITGGRW